MPYQDGTYTSAVQDGPKRVFYPFLNSPAKDTTTKGTVRNYVVLPGSFTPASALSTDPDDATQYLIEETELAVEAGVGRFARSYCKVPGDQVFYSSLVINKPDAADYGTLLRANIADYVNGSAGTVFLGGAAYSYGGSYFAADSVFPITTCSGALTLPSGGTFTLTYKTSTTAALPYNESAPNIESALNALASVVSDGLTFSVSGSPHTGQIDLTLTSGSTSTSVTGSGASLTPSASTSMLTLRSTTTSQTVRVGSRATISAHGYAGTENLIVNGAATSLFPPSLWAVVDSNTIATYYNASFSSVGANLRDYTAGTDRVLTRITDSFYLPGVTSGITTGADIPVPSVAINDTALLTLIANNATGFQTYDAEPIAQWPADPSPIYRQRIIAIDVDDL